VNEFRIGEGDRADIPAPERKVAHTATQAADQSNALVKIGRATVRDSVVGMVDTSTDPTYRLFVAIKEAELKNLSNQLREDTAEVHLRGAFMENGPMAVDGTFRPEKNGPDFDLAVRIEDTDLQTLNDLLRAYGGFDVAGGRFFFYSELHVRNGEVRGYVKPIFKDIDVYSSGQDADKPVLRKVYEGLVGGVANLFENRGEEQVATETEVRGRIGGDVRSSTWQIVLGLVRNAFFQAVLPGLDREIRTARRR